jgi:hypothetical protein
MLFNEKACKKELRSSTLSGNKNSTQGWLEMHEGRMMLNSMDEMIGPVKIKKFDVLRPFKT